MKPTRLLLYCMLLGLLPLLAISSYFIKEHRAWKSLTLQIDALSHLCTTQARKQNLNALVCKKFSHSDPRYLSHFPLFLQKERRALEKLSQDSHSTGNCDIENRLAFLTQEGNTLVWKEMNRLSGEGMVETAEVAEHPIEIDLDDLRALLERIERDHPSKPQLLIRNFELTKKTKSSGLEVFELNLSLIKREYE